MSAKKKVLTQHFLQRPEKERFSTGVRPSETGTRQKQKVLTQHFSQRPEKERWLAGI